MTHCYRIVKKAYEQTAFSGEGPASHPGRWNHRGYRMVYTAESRALAAFEYMVNMQRKSAKKSKFSLFTIVVPKEVKIIEKTVKELPRMWRKVPPQDTTRDIGTAWLKDRASAVLVVPSSIIPEERNFLLNPLHPDFSKILISHPQSFSFDTRIAKILLG